MNELSNELPDLTSDFWLKLKQKCSELQIISLHIIPTDYAIGGKKSFEEKFGNGVPEDLEYLTRNQEVRNNPGLILEGARSVISISLSYHSSDYPADPHTGYISAYARGRDYHKVIKQRLDRLGNWLKNTFPDIRFRAITDSAPFYEQHFAKASVFMAKGRNNLVRLKNAGSMIFLGELLTTLNLPDPKKIITMNTEKNTESDYPFFTTVLNDASDENSNNCISGLSSGKNSLECPEKCRLCFSSCPTGALNPEKFRIEKCISYLTIEYGGYIPEELWSGLENRIYGCDTCQLCCPFNKKTDITADPEFSSRFSQDFLKLSHLLSLTPEEFKKSFSGTPILRIGYYKMMRNCIIAAVNTGSSEYISCLVILRNSVLKRMNLLHAEITAGNTDGEKYSEPDRLLREISECTMVLRHLEHAFTLLRNNHD